MYRTFFCCLFSLWLVSASWGQDLNPEYVPGVVAVQFAPEVAHKTGAHTGLQEFDARAARYEMESLERVYPFLDHVDPTPKTRQNLLALRRTYYVRYRSQASPEQVASDLHLVHGIVYAEPVVISRRDALSPRERVPNDPKFHESPYLRRLRLPEAWEIVKGEDGSPRVVLAIIDDGGEWGHEDLLSNVWTNPGEIAGNNIDDDQNGFVDDVHGVNFRTGASNDPLANTPDSRYHGTAMAGIAGASTNNGIGVSGSAWNVDLMHVNVGCASLEDDEKGLCEGYKGILYAASNGADIISASWGAVYTVTRSRLLDQTLDLATDMGALVVSSAGNRGIDFAEHWEHVRYYPAHHPRVLSVGATERDTSRLWYYSTYGRGIDVYAPGRFLHTTLRGDTYGYSSGTSAATALVAGVAALVKTKYPDWPPDRIRDTIRLTSESIEAANPSHAGKLDGGFVNALTAVNLATAVPHQALKALYTSTNGEQWRMQSGWDTGTVPPSMNDFAQWHGLFVRDEALVQIDLSRNNLRGTLPPELGRLSRLRKLSLERNHLTGSIPPAFGKLTSLKILHLRGNRLTGLPPEIGNLSNLRILYLGENQLTTLPLELGKLSKLRVLRLQGNYLTVLPSELGNLLNLRDLRLQGNRLTRLPPEIGKLANLEYLDLSSNQLSGEVPSELCQLSRLEVLYLGENNLTGSLPRCLMDLQNLTTLSFGISGACAPSDDEFQVWLRSLSSLEGPACGSGVSFSDSVGDQSYASAHPIVPLILPEVDGDRQSVTYMLAPALPAGLRFDPSTRMLSGTPTEVISPTVFTYTAVEAGEYGDQLTFQIEVHTSVSAEQDALPVEFVVHDNYPNPFNPGTRIQFDLPERAQVQVQVVDLLGREVMMVPAQEIEAGANRSIELHAAGLASGTYLYRLIATGAEQSHVKTGRMTLVK